ncbi:MAG: hypothetical protein MI862_08190 [Desulfobacterales bacterium]|nr:hypothetical protein [Desulfobacterales bacterium]
MSNKLGYKIFFIVGLIVILFDNTFPYSAVPLVLGSVLSFYGALGMLLEDFFIKLKELKKLEER